MIKKLSKEEIEEINIDIEGLRSNENYKYYFCENEIVNFPEEAYLIDNYYVDFTKYNGLVWVGVLNLTDKAISTSYYDLMSLLLNRLKHYKKLFMWCYLDNDISIRFHNLLIKKFNAKQAINNDMSIIEIGGL